MADPEIQAEPSASDIRPAVARTANNRGVWLFVAGLAVAGTGLFSALEARRSTISSPAIAVPPAATGAMIAPPPELAIPAPLEPYGYAQAMPPMTALAPSPPAMLAPARLRGGSAYVPSPPPPSYGPQPAGPQLAPPAPSPAYAFRSGPDGPSSPLKAAADGGGEGGAGTARALASRLANPSTTVPQGTVIQAVMETALDSNRAGFARAVVSRDVMSFDGSRVLIPKGSRLFGEYKADLAAGQNRAMIQWRRLTRPDGGIIDVDSPSADPVGRAGVKGKVNSHFFAKFGGAILQSALDIGSGYANRSISGDTFYLGSNNSMQNLVQSKQQDVKPTLTVRQGTGVSVFVGRDLDFTAVEQ